MRKLEYQLRTLALFASILAMTACGDSSVGGNLDGGTVDASSDRDAVVAVVCEPLCESGTTCVDGSCCTDTQVCGDSCCGTGAVCSFGQCLQPGADCLDASECSDNEYCELTLGDEPGEVPAMCVGGTAPNPGRCLPRPPICPDGEVPDDPTSCLVSCEYRPPASAFMPELKYSWGSPTAPNNRDSIMMTPIVIQLDDDNCDGVVNQRDIPEIVFMTFTGGQYRQNGTLHAISVVEGIVVDKWSVTNATNHPGLSIAGGNIDGIPGNEVVVCTSDGRVRAYDASGNELWLSEAGVCGMISLADIDQNGTTEVIAGNRVFAGATGTTVLTIPMGGRFIAADVTGNGILDLVGPRGVVDFGGNLLVDYVLSDGSAADGDIAIADLDNDGIPEIALIDSSKHMLHIWHMDSAAPNGYTRVRDFLDINGTIDPSRCPSGSAGRTRGGGPPTIADANGDGFPDIALAGGVGYTVFDGQKLVDASVANSDTILWAKETQDCSSARTGSSVFDFNGDGSAEIAYGDETHLRVYDGQTGATLFETCNTNGTLQEYPVIADVDNDGRADLVVISNSYSSFNCEGVKTAGVRIFGSMQDDWVRTRRVWNQHAYHVTNVEESGEIPRVEAANYLNPKLNNFRLNVQPEGEFSAPDLRVEILPSCAANSSFVVRVRNFGETAAPAGIPVTAYVRENGMAPVLLPGGPYVTTRPLYPAEAEDIEVIPASALPADATVRAVVDENPNHAWQECNLDNNSSEEVLVGCQID
ncbi:MAG: VCBS repeat-containing protein [Kofleriaceae bacterium]|nr:VCBS repeat-containing protein [Kofleriaceae bacterium]